MEKNSTLNIFQRISAISAEVLNVQKKLTVSTGTSSYKAVSDYDVTLAVKQAEAKHGVCSYVINQELLDNQILEATNESGYKRTQFVDIVKLTLRAVNVDDPQDFIEVVSFGRGIDTGDKSFGKASTYARKYALLNLYKIATGEDPDQEGSEDRHYHRPTTNKPTDNPADKPADKPAPEQKQKKVQTLTMAHIDNCKADKVIDFMSHYNPDNDAEWAAGIGSLEVKALIKCENAEVENALRNEVRAHNVLG